MQWYCEYQHQLCLPGGWTDARIEQAPAVHPFFRHKQNSPVVSKVVKEYTPLEMCTHILVGIPLKLNTAYHSDNQDSFATNVGVLILWLEAANLNIK